MKNLKLITCILITSALLMDWNIGMAQDEEKKEKPRPQRKAFESAVLSETDQATCMAYSLLLIYD